MFSVRTFWRKITRRVRCHLAQSGRARGHGGRRGRESLGPPRRGRAAGDDGPDRRIGRRRAPIPSSTCKLWINPGKPGRGGPGADRVAGKPLSFRALAARGGRPRRPQGFPQKPGSAVIHGRSGDGGSGARAPARGAGPRDGRGPATPSRTRFLSLPPTNSACQQRKARA